MGSAGWGGGGGGPRRARHAGSSFSKNHAAAFQSLSQGLQWTRRYDEALAATDRWIAIAPTNFFAYETKAMILVSRGDLAAARAIVEKPPAAIPLTRFVANFATGTGDGSVIEYPANGGAPIPLASGLNGPTGLALDTAGVLYVALATDNKIVTLSGGNAPILFVTLDPNSNPQGMAFAPNGESWDVDALYIDGDTSRPDGPAFEQLRRETIAREFPDVRTDQFRATFHWTPPPNASAKLSCDAEDPKPEPVR